MLCGLDQLLGSDLSPVRRRLRSARFGVLTHSAAVDRRGRQTLEVLEELGANPAVVFTPEHGFDAVEQAQEPVADAQQSAWSAPMVSLYGSGKESLAPAGEHLNGLDLLLVDLVDVGTRYYTYIWSALLAARAARAAGVHTLVLDRPNPLSGDPASIEGAPQREDYCSFVGLEPLPIRHAMTVGEILAHFFARDGHTLGAEGALSVVRTRGWERSCTASAWSRPFVMPSPNMPTLETAFVYPGGCLLEGTNLSEGRGTTVPFQAVGAPFLDGQALTQSLRDHAFAGAQIRSMRFRPTFDKFAGEVCSGLMLHVTDSRLFRPVATYLALVTLARAQAPEHFAFRTGAYEFETERYAFDLLTGSPLAREAIEAGARADDVAELVAPVDPMWRDVVRQAEALLDRAEA
jgi:uncharacterized protein YbbC (DUF1343 family)